MSRKYNKKITHLYMKVTDDKYEFPVAIADTAKELAAICGANKNTISSSISKKIGRYRKVKL